MTDDNVMVKMAICPKCKNAIKVAIQHTMDKESKKDFSELVINNDLQVITISLKEYRDRKIKLFHDKKCS